MKKTKYKMSDEDKRELTKGFTVIKKPTATEIFNSKVLVFGFSLKDGSDFFFEDETIDEIQSIIDLNEFLFCNREL